MAYLQRSLRTALWILLLGVLSGSGVFAQSAACDWSRVRLLHPVAEISAPRTAASKTGIGLALAGLGLMVAGVANRPAEAGPGPA